MYDGKSGAKMQDSQGQYFTEFLSFVWSGKMCRRLCFLSTAQGQIVALSPVAFHYLKCLFLDEFLFQGYAVFMCLYQHKKGGTKE